VRAQEPHKSLSTASEDTSVETRIPQSEDELKMAMAREFEDAAVEVLITKTVRAAVEYGARSIIVGGGVSANTHLRCSMRDAVRMQLPDTQLYIPDQKLSTDNAVMIGVVGLMRFERGPDAYRVNPDIPARGNARLHVQESDCWV
jgi:tRNA A37 threonylcarbamoyltransferase TsaD